MKKGFTLIEIMIVVGIIAILAAILIPNYLRVRSQSLLVACDYNLKNIADALHMYEVDNDGNYPAGSGQLAMIASALSPNYLKAFPVCPIQNTPYSYTGQNNPPYQTFTISQVGNLHQEVVGTGTPPSGCLAYPCYGSTAGLYLGK